MWDVFVHMEFSLLSVNLQLHGLGSLSVGTGAEVLTEGLQAETSPWLSVSAAQGPVGALA